MAKEKKEVEPEEETEEYLKYVMKYNTINITVQAGGMFVMQSGNPTPPKVPPGNP